MYRFTEALTQKERVLQ